MTTEDTTPAPILVGVDGSEPALDAVRWAAAEAVRRGAPLRLVHAVGRIPPDFPRGADGGDALRRAAHGLVAQAAAIAADVAPRVHVLGEVLADHPVPRLVSESRRAQLVVVGGRGLGGLAGLLVGSVALALVAHATCPVVVLHPARAQGPAPTGGPILVGVDGSPAGDAALGFAFEAAASRGAMLVATHTWEIPALLVPAAAVLVDWTAVADGERRLLDECVDCWGEKFPGVPVQRVVRKDRPAHALVERSADAQLVVVGSRGRGNVTGMVLGSVSHAVLHHARCPVAVVHAEPRAEPH